jgi:RNA-directed DNA polymerase
MERSNQPPKTECCPDEGQAPVDLKFFKAERRRGSVHRELREPQAGVAPSLSHSASKLTNAGGDGVLLSTPNMNKAAQGEALDNLPGSQSVAREAGADRNLGGPESPRRTNCESQAGRGEQRQEALTGDQGIGSAHSNPRQGSGPDSGEGADASTQPAQATRTARTAEYRWPTFLRAIADKAARDKHHRFGDLYRQLNEPALRQSFYLLRQDAASGVDGVTFEEYEKNLDSNLANLVQRLKNKSYKAKLVRRKYIPKGQGKWRPLGIPALEDKLLQCAVTQILMAIYEADFLPCSYGYRPVWSPHDAVRELTDELFRGKHNFVVEADVKGFFDNLRHEALLEMLGQRIQDGALLGLIRKWLRAGILEEDGKVIHPVLGTPQGGIVSPVLANVYLHYVLDQWFEQEVKKKNRGQCRLFRFADDFVACFEYRHEAVAFEQALKERLAQYGLEVAPEKTKTIRFGRNGGPYNGRFDFLGFELSWAISRKGQPYVKRRTSRKKLQASVRGFTDWIKKSRHQKVRKLMKTVAAKYQGYWNYYGLIGNSEGLKEFYWQSTQLLFKWLNRRSQRPSYTWRAFHRLLDRFGVPAPRIVESERKQLAIPCCWGWKLGQLLARYMDLRPA